MLVTVVVVNAVVGREAGIVDGDSVAGFRVVNEEPKAVIEISMSFLYVSNMF